MLWNLSYEKKSKEIEQQKEATSYSLEQIDPKILKPHPKNYRTHPPDEIAHIRASIKQNGIYRNIVIANDNVILAGHGVVQTCLQMGLTEIPVRRLPISSEDPRALKVLAGDNEIGHLSVIDDRALTQMLKDIKELDELMGTGFDDKMLASLVMVTRPANEIADFDTAAHWVGMPQYDRGGPQYKLIVNFETPAERERFAAQYPIEIASRGNITWSTRWPYKPNDDCQSVRFEPRGEAPAIIPDTRIHEWTSVTNRDFFEECPINNPSEAQLKRWIDFRIAYNKAQQLEAPADFPVQVDFELNGACDLRCSFCIHGQKKMKSANEKQKEIKFEQFQKVIEESERYGLASIKLNDINEPLLNPRLPEYIRYAKAHGILNVYLATNGTHLDEVMGSELIDAGLSKIMISIDAATPETYKRMRQADKFELVCSNLRRFLDLRKASKSAFPWVRVNFLKTEWNISEADEFVKQWSGMVESIGFQDAMGVPGLEGDEEAAKTLRLQNREKFQCSFPFKMLAINCHGQIQACCGAWGRKQPIGHIDTLSLHEAWTCPAIQDLRLLHFENRYAENLNCLRCIRGGEGE